MKRTPTTNAELFNEAKKWHDLGLPVIPFDINWNEEKQQYKKNNIGKWGKWETEIQTDEEFNNLNWLKANGFGIIPGMKAKNGMYLGIVDFDTKAPPTESEEQKQKRLQSIEKGKKITKDLPITELHKTANKGQHLVYWSKTPVETKGDPHDDFAVELLGTKKLCLMPPSKGYKRLNDNTPTIVNDLEETFFAVCKKHGWKPKKKNQEEQKPIKTEFNISQLVDLSKLVKLASEDYQGKHPFHDSTTEKNFCVNVKKNVWYCHRHNTGGGPLQFLAMKEGIITCEECGKGALKGSKFKKVVKLAVQQGLMDKSILSQSGINPIVLAKDIKMEYVFVTDKQSNELYYFDEKEGIYNGNIEQHLKREIVKRLDENFKNRYYTEIFEYIRASVPLVTMDSGNPEFLPVKNGVLNVLTDELTNYNPGIYTTSKIDAIFNPNQKWEKSYNKRFLEDAVQSSVHRQQMQELVGASLYKLIITEISLVCYGKGGNGKSIWLTVLKEFLGQQNISGLTLQQICYDKFATLEIRGKLANVFTDLPKKEILNSGMYKAVTSGDAVPISKKHVQGTGQTFTPFAQFFYSANHLPEINSKEDCYAWYRRFVFADFNRTFTDKDKIPRQEFLNKLITPEEKSAFLNWALEGLKILYKNGELSELPTVAKIRTEYRKRASTILAYLDENIVETNSPNDIVWLDDWHRHYVSWCIKKGHKQENRGNFQNTCEENLTGIRKKRKRKEGAKNPTVAYVYVKTVPGVSDVQLSKSYESQQKKLSKKNRGNNKFEKSAQPAQSALNSEDIIDELLEPKENEVIYKGQKETMDLPKRWHTGKETKD